MGHPVLTVEIHLTRTPLTTANDVWLLLVVWGCCLGDCRF